MIEAVSARPRLRRVTGAFRFYAQLSRTRRAVLWVGLVQLIRAWAKVRMSAFSSYSDSLGVAVNGDPEWDWSGNDAAMTDVIWAVEGWNNRLGGRFTCLMKAMAGQMLLARCGIGSAIVLGVKPGRSSADPTAHAWLRVGRLIVLGDRERPGHIAVASYRLEPDSIVPARAHD